MKKIIAVGFLLICGLLVFLATIDLEPYLASEQPDIAHSDAAKPSLLGRDELPDKDDAAGPPAADATVIPAQPESVGQSRPETQSEATFEDRTAAAPIDASTTGRGQATASAATQMPSSLIELQVERLPEGEYPFSILLETFTEQATAEMAMPYYEKRGLSPHWVKVHLGEQGIQYRLFTGVFATMPEAQLYLDLNKLVDRPIKATYYAARIGVYQDKAELASTYVKTKNAGVIPYILGTQNGDYHLYVGAFYTFIGAAEQCRNLRDAGLRCEPIKRSTIPPR
ncbi:hypothetical protein [Desulfocastanea catecholica]